MKHLKTGSVLSYGFATTRFGMCCIAFDGTIVYALLFPQTTSEAEIDLKSRFPKTRLHPEDSLAGKLIEEIFEKNKIPEIQALGTDFQQSVWKALLEIPTGCTTTYAKIASAIGRPKSVRAVGTAIGANPIAYLIPCHRVIRSNGGLGGYRWGLDCKRKMLEWEKTRN